MIDLTPEGGDGTSIHDVVFRLGEIYGFTCISEDLAYRYNIPQHWYGRIQAFYLANVVRKAAMIEFQMLPAPDFPSILLPLAELLKLIDDGEVSVKYFQQAHHFDEFNTRLKLVIQTTEEHIDLLLDNPELLEDWKIHCLYPHILFDQRVKASYDWLTAQTDWFDIDPHLIDWIFLVQQLIHIIDRSSNQDDDSDGGIPAGIH